MSFGSSDKDFSSRFRSKKVNVCNSSRRRCSARPSVEKEIRASAKALMFLTHDFLTKLRNALEECPEFAHTNSSTSIINTQSTAFLQFRYQCCMHIIWVNNLFCITRANSVLFTDIVDDACINTTTPEFMSGPRVSLKSSVLLWLYK